MTKKFNLTDDKSHYANIKNSSNTQLVVLDSYSTTDISGNIDDKLKIISNDADKSQVIKAAATGRVTLNDTYIDPDTKQQSPSLIYRLVFSSSSNLFPLGIGVADFILSDDDANLELKPDDLTSMKSAAQFYQAVNAYPSSDLAKSFRSILDDTSKTSNTSDDIETKINNFFKGTKGYTNVTLSSYNAVLAYFNDFPYVWADYTNSKTYYLYSSDGKNPLKAQGTLTLTSSATGIPDPTDASGGYKIEYKDTSSKVTALSYKNGQFVSDLTSDIPDIVLSGTFELKSRLTANPSDNQVIAILTGSLFGNTIIGLDTEQNPADKAGDSYWKILFHPQNAQQTIQSILTLGGLGFMAHFLFSGLYKFFNYLKGKISQGKKPSTDEVEKARKQTSDEARQDFDESIKKNSAGKEKAPEDIDSAQSNAAEAMEQELGWGNKTSIEITLEIEDVRIRIIIENTTAPTPEMQAAASKLKNINEQLKEATPNNISDVVSKQSDAIKTASAEVTKVQQDVEQGMSEQIKEQLEAQQKASDAANEDLDDARENAEKTNDGTGDGADDDFGDIPIE